MAHRLLVPFLLAALLLTGFVQIVSAAPPSQAGSISITVGAITGLVSDQGHQAIPYAGNVTVSATVTMDCSLVAYEVANKMGQDIDHFHVQPADETLPGWLVADEFLVYFTPAAAGTPAFPFQECASGTGTFTKTVDYPFGVAAGAPGVVSQILNLTANLGDDAIADAVPVPFAVQFHANYSIEPSLKFPDEVTGAGVDFTLLVRNDGNAPAMVMFNGAASSVGSLTGLDDVMLDAGQSQTLSLTYTGPGSCWTTATTTATAVIHPMVGGKAGNATAPQPIAWTFTHAGCASATTKGTGTSTGSTAAAQSSGQATGSTTTKKSASLAPLPVVGAALIALALRRRNDRAA